MNGRKTEPGLGLFGPTCAWKSSTAIALAHAVGGEVVSCDSMQVYRGMDIGTATPSAEDQQGVPHHLLSTLDIQETCDAHAFVQEAEKQIRAIRGRGHTPIVAGGSGLYARALMYGLTMLPADRCLMKTLETGIEQPGGKEELLLELSRAPGGDSIPAEIRQNPRRLLRAVEVLRLTGRPPWNHDVTPQPRPDFREFVILPEMAVLRPRIKARVQQMLAEGWLEETRTLVHKGLLTTPTARQVLGYRDIATFLEASVASLADLEETLTRRTVHFARRQRTWFRHQHPAATLIIVRRDTNATELSKHILQLSSGGNPLPAQSQIVID